MRYLYLLSLLIFLSCQENDTKLTAQQIIDRTIINSGTYKVANSLITFQFRDKSYKGVRKNGRFELERTYNTATSTIKDVISNNGFVRYENDSLISVADSMANKYSNAVNSVHYFSVLPHGLNDRAVHKKLLPSSTVNGKAYYKIEISFSRDGGGEDFDDVFIYWIGREDFLIDYLAYSYHTNGGGTRFRVLKEQCIKNGIRFVDYINYKPTSKNNSLVDLDAAFEKKELIKVSDIVLSHIEVTILAQ